MRFEVHAGKIHPAKEGGARLGLAGYPLHTSARRFIVNGFHPFDG